MRTHDQRPQIHRPGNGDVDVGDEAALSQQSLPHLDADDAEDREYEEAQHENVAEHRQRVEQQRYQDTHVCSSNIRHHHHQS